MIVASLVFGLSSVATASESHFARSPVTADRARVYVPEGGAAIAPRSTLDRATVRAALARARAANLAAFRAYQKKGVFPSNTFKPGKLNVWRDADGHLCAAATIINASGQSDLVDRVAEQNNFIRLADVEQGPLMDWILTSGLTQDEIAAIQEPFMPVVEQPQLEPERPLVVDTKLRKAEDARLRAKYRAVERMVVRNRKKSLDVAIDRWMKRPALARQLVDAQPVAFAR
jgi:hypothetical protein